MIPGEEKDLRACMLCEHRCGADRLAGERGVCRMGGPVVASRTLHPAPPESYTVFMAGCNFKCLHCQNWSISQFPDNGMPVEGYVEPDALASESLRRMDSLAGRLMRADRIFFSGGEPTVHLPYIERVVSRARARNPSCKVNFDTNGYMTEESLERILRFATSLTFDIKAFSDDTHRALTGAPAAPVLRNAEIVAKRAGDKVWEFRIVVIPQVNEDDIEPICRFIARISAGLPVCFLAFRPNFVLEDHGGSSRELMENCVDVALDAGLRNVTWSGRTDIPGTQAPKALRGKEGNASDSVPLAVASVSRRGCAKLPRDCRSCGSNSACPVKAYKPSRST